MFDFKPTKRGLLRAEFRDRFGAKCSLQESSYSDEDCIWFGVDVDLSGDEVPQGRMHLTQAQAKQLLPILRHFARTGKLGQDGLKHYEVGAWVRGVGPDNYDVQGRIVHRAGESITVQDYHKRGPEGQHVTYGAAVELHWEPMEMPEHIPTRYERIAADDDDPV